MANAMQISFASGFVESRGSVRVICQIDDDATSVPAIARWVGEGQPWALFPMQWVPVRLAAIGPPQPCLFALGGDGTVGYGYGSYDEERIDATNEGPLGRGPLRDLRLVGGELFAAGMSRQVYQRVGPGRWIRRDQGVVAPLGQIEPSGFTSIDGLSPDRLWAVGYFGEIWSCTGTTWTRHDSPTNVILHRLRVVPGEGAFACGQKGIVLGATGDDWTELVRIENEDNLWGIEWFGGRLYLASEKTLYRYSPGGESEVVAVPGVASFGHLHANDGVLWSFGTKDLAFTVDGDAWSRVSPLR